ncbi:hypothetical protein SEA_LILBEANIE_67 [Gordonia phage Lilbeanie]|uniref:Uncharacterized protein n=1 Tax=Gordonia phage Lilbeanie TaxID=2794947 RepID=A0A7T1NWI5_9CAUD|nr:hypothetical protein J1773_gp67 [Gordonia phage Lilbeanie]QPO17145.1 hypothetical protein SEA_LILBEANIE_67 [Gordonia phage Lilbeanie]
MKIVGIPQIETIVVVDVEDAPDIKAPSYLSSIQPDRIELRYYTTSVRADLTGRVRLKSGEIGSRVVTQRIWDVEKRDDMPTWLLELIEELRP